MRAHQSKHINKLKVKTNTIIVSLFFSYLIAGNFISAQKKIKTPKLKFESSISLKIPEPSDITLSPSGNSFYIVSDDAILFETDLQGTVLRKSNVIKGIDFEGVWSDDKYVYVADETARKIHLYEHQDLKHVKTLNFSYSGGRNKGVESITYNKAKQVFVLITETDPSIIFETDSNFIQLNEKEWKASRDVSAATYHEDHIWLLSDEDMTVFKCNPLTYEVVGKWKINVLNPEGIAFDKNNRMIILSDDLERMYFFSHPELNQK